jgi:aminomethyltransferase
MLRNTPFASRNIRGDAECMDAYGFAAPLVVSDTIEEYWAVRRAAGLLDFSMLTKFEIEGPGALEAVNSVVARDLEKVRPGRIAYGPVVNDDGMMLDDSTCMVFNRQRVRVIGGPALPAVVDYATSGRGLKVTDLRERVAHLNLQGPLSRSILARLVSGDVSNDAFGYYTYRENLDVAGIACFATRMGYTAELGYELFPPVDQALDLWDALIEAGADDGLLPVGINAIFIMRTEAGMALGDVDYDETISPWECNLGWAVSLDKQPYRGQEALLRLRDTAPWRMVTVRLDGGGDAATGAVLKIGGEDIGQIGMAVVSPVFDNATIAVGRVTRDHASVGTEVAAHFEDKSVNGRIVPTPAYDPERIRVRS